MASDDMKKTLKDLENSLKKMKIGKENLSKFSKDFDKTKKNTKEIEENSKLIQRTLRDLVRFNTEEENLNLDVAFILASNDDEVIDEIRKIYYHKNFKWINDIDDQISDYLIDIYGLYSDSE
jgi:CRISPR/Cas system-associated protein Csm6